MKPYDDSRRQFLKTLGLGIAAFSLPGCSRAMSSLRGSNAKGTPPNIVLIMADDMGYSDIGCYGSEIKTPNLDALAANGVRFTQFYNGARCCPSRAALLTGLYAHQAGMGCMEPDWKVPGYRGNINDRCVTIAEALKLNGYSTYMTGKWHLTNKTKVTDDADKFDWPCQRGFDRYFGTIVGAGNYFAPATLTRDNTNIEEEAKNNPEFYYTDAISDNAVKFIKEHCRETPDKPFFEYVAFTAPHWPLHAKEKDIQKYLGKYDKGWDVLKKERYERMIKMGIIDKNWKMAPRDERVAAWDDLENADITPLMKECAEKNGGMKKIMAYKMACYAAMIDCMDQGIGRIVKALKDTGQLDNTLILFLSDNGGCDEWGTYGFGWENLQKTGKIGGVKESSTSYGPAWANPSNTPFRLYKLHVHEGGISTPLIAHWPNYIKEKGAMRNDIGHIIDIMPTALDASNGTYPETYNGNVIQPMEGVSLLPAFSSKPLARKDAIYWEHIGNHAIRDGKWKLVARGENGAWELYDMEADRTEHNDLAEKHPDIVRKLNDKWYAWAERCNVLPMNPNKKRKE